MTPTQQLIAKLRECETTQGPYYVVEQVDGIPCESPWIGCHDEGDGNDVVCEYDEEPWTNEGYKKFLQRAHGIATLKNSNPTVIAMLERAIGALAYYARFSSDAATASAALAHLDALAREALKENPDAE